MKILTPTENSIHVGQLLKDYLSAHKIIKSALARKIVKNDNEILRYQKSASLKTEVLLALSHALKHNFFADIALLLPTNYSQTISGEVLAKDLRIAELEQQILILEAEKAVLLSVMKS
jgi:hypothetical protein